MKKEAILIFENYPQNYRSCLLIGNIAPAQISRTGHPM